jgi:hypothetical protein
LKGSAHQQTEYLLSCLLSGFLDAPIRIQLRAEEKRILLARDEPRKVVGFPRIKSAYYIQNTANTNNTTLTTVVEHAVNSMQPIYRNYIDRQTQHHPTQPIGKPGCQLHTATYIEWETVNNEHSNIEITNRTVGVLC